MTTAATYDRFSAALAERHPAVGDALGADGDRELALGVVAGLDAAFAHLVPGTAPDVAAARLFIDGRIDRPLLANLLLLLTIRDRFALPSSVHWDFRHIWHLAQGLTGRVSPGDEPPQTDAWLRFEHAALAAMFALDRLAGGEVQTSAPVGPSEKDVAA